MVTVENLGGMGEVHIRPSDPAEATTFQWQDMLRGDLMLMSLANHRYLLAKACAPPPLKRDLFRLGSGGRQIAEGLPSSEQQALVSASPSPAEALSFRVR